MDILNANKLNRAEFIPLYSFSFSFGRQKQLSTMLTPCAYAREKKNVCLYFLESMKLGCKGNCCSFIYPR